MIFLLLACAPHDPAWAINLMSAVPDANGITGTQTWEFFDKRWGRSTDDDAYVCARVQTFTGTVLAAPEGCEQCVAAYELTFEELDSDCDALIAVDPAYLLPIGIGVGAVPDDIAHLDPHTDRSLGWYASFAGPAQEPYGFAWDGAVDYGGDPGPPGWNDGQAYTLWPAFAWDLAGSGT